MRNLSWGIVTAAWMLCGGAIAQDAPEQQAVIETSLGTITVTLDREHAPLTARNFTRYAREKHFDGTVIYRVVPGALIQAGSYDADGNPRSTHAPIPLEANNGQHNIRGAIAMARSEPNSATAEFFIDVADLPSLDHDPKDAANTTGYAVFGHVTAGMDVVDKIAGVQLGGKGPFGPAAPLVPVTIEKVSIVEKVFAVAAPAAPAPQN